MQSVFILHVHTIFLKTKIEVKQLVSHKHLSKKLDKYHSLICSNSLRITHTERKNISQQQLQQCPRVTSIYNQSYEGIEQGGLMNRALSLQQFPQSCDF